MRLCGIEKVLLEWLCFKSWICTYSSIVCYSFSQPVVYGLLGGLRRVSRGSANDHSKINDLMRKIKAWNLSDLMKQTSPPGKPSLITVHQMLMLMYQNYTFSKSIAHGSKNKIEFSEFTKKISRGSAWSYKFSKGCVCPKRLRTTG